jgi:hypothetical protein
MSRYSPTVGPYQDAGGSFLGEYLDFLRTKQYYDYAREEMQLRREMQEQDRSLELLSYGQEYPDLEYSPNRYPGERRLVKDPVWAGPSVQQAPGLGVALESEMAEPGKPVALAGELVPGVGFTSKNVYRSVPVDPTRYEELTPGLYRDTKYDPRTGLANEIGGMMSMFPGLDEQQAEFLAQNPELMYSLPRNALYGEPSVYDQFRSAALEAEMEKMLGDREFEDWKRRQDYQQTLREQSAAAQEQRYRTRQRTTSTSGGGSPSLANNAMYQAIKRQVDEYGVGSVTDEFAQQLGLRNRDEAMRWYTTGGGYPEMTPERSPQSGVQEIMDAAWRTLEMFGPTGEGPAEPERRIERSTTEPTRRRRGGG